MGPRREPAIRRVLFVSFACDLDDANGAGVASRAVMETPARRILSVDVPRGHPVDISSGRR
jgi:hypothetical protein